MKTVQGRAGGGGGAPVPPPRLTPLTPAPPPRFAAAGCLWGQLRGRPGDLGTAAWLLCGPSSLRANRSPLPPAPGDHQPEGLRDGAQGPPPLGTGRQDTNAGRPQRAPRSAGLGPNVCGQAARAQALSGRPATPAAPRPRSRGPSPPPASCPPPAGRLAAWPPLTQSPSLGKGSRQPLGSLPVSHS